MMTNQCEVPCGRSPMSEDLLSICPRLLRAVPVTFTTPPRSPDGEERDEQRRETMGVKETDLLEEMDLSMVECLNQVSDDRPSFTSGWWRKSAAQRAAPTERSFAPRLAGRKPFPWGTALNPRRRPASLLDVRRCRRALGSRHQPAAVRSVETYRPPPARLPVDCLLVPLLQRDFIFFITKVYFFFSSSALHPAAGGVGGSHGSGRQAL